MTKRLIGLKTLIAISLLSLSGCKQVSKDIKPQIHYTVQDRYLKALSSPFSNLSERERETQWGSEYLIGLHFARNLDFYRAITALRRAEILVPENENTRKLEMQYEILLAYYLGGRFQDLDRAYTDSDLSQVPIDFPAFHDLLVILYDTYLQLDETKKSTYILDLIHQYDPKTHQDLVLYTSLQKANFSSSDLPLLKTYEEQKKSSTKAVLFNAILPGAGYFYLKQFQTALTALLVNGLFIAAAIFFTRRRAIAAALIFLSFEAGWYFGGISGASWQTKFYNERVYEQIINPYMNQQGLFPIYKLDHGF